MRLQPQACAIPWKCPQPCFWAEHDGQKVIRSGFGIFITSRKLLCFDAQAELDAEIARLNLAHDNITKRQRAAALFQSFPENVRTPFVAVFEAIDAISNDADVLPAVQAVTVTPELESYKAQLIAVLS